MRAKRVFVSITRKSTEGAYASRTMASLLVKRMIGETAEEQAGARRHFYAKRRPALRGQFVGTDADWNTFEPHLKQHFDTDPEVGRSAEAFVKDESWWKIYQGYKEILALPDSPEKQASADILRKLIPPEFMQG